MRDLRFQVISLAGGTRCAAVVSVETAPGQAHRLVGLWERELRFILDYSEFADLSQAADATCCYMLSQRLVLREVDVRAVLVELRRGEKVVRCERSWDDAGVSFREEEKSFGRVDILFEDATLGLYRLRVAPGAYIPAHVHHVMREYEMVLGSELLLQGKPVRAGEVFAWPVGFPHRYDNPSSLQQAILCIDHPPFAEGDEVEVDVPMTALPPVVGRSYD